MSELVRRHWFNALLALLAVLGGLAYALFDRGTTSTTEARERARSVFEVLRQEDVTELSVSVAGRAAHMTRGAPDDAGQRPWSTEIGGVRYAAEEQVVDQYLGVLEFAVVDHRIAPDGVDRARFGLTTPRLEVDVVMGKRSARLLIGGRAPTPEDGVYIEVEGRGVAVITKQLLSSLDVDPDGFRERALLAWELDGIGAVTIERAQEGAAGSSRLVRAAAKEGKPGSFRVDRPDGMRAPDATIERIGTALGFLKADGYLDDAAADRAAEPRLTVTIAPADAGTNAAATGTARASPVVIELGGLCRAHAGDVVAIRRAPTRANACVPEAALDGLLLDADKLVDRRLIGAPLDRITELKFQEPGRLVEMARRASEWHLRSPQDRPLDAATGQAIAEGLLAIEATRFVNEAEAVRDRKALGLDAPRGTVRVISVVPTGGAGGPDEERAELLTVGGPPAAGAGDVIYVQRAEDGAVAAVPAAQVGALFPSDQALRSLKLVDEPVQAIRSIRVERGGRVQRIERGEDGAFRWMEPSDEGLAVDAELANELADAVGSLTALRWAGLEAPRDAAADAFGLEHPRLTIQAEAGSAATDGGPAGRTIELRLGAATAGGTFARLGSGSDDAVFVAPKSVEEAADRWLADRAALTVDADVIARIELAAAGGKKLAIERRGETFSVVGVTPDATTAATAAGVRDALGDLTAEGAVSVGNAEAHEGFDKPRGTVTVTLAGEAAARGPVKLTIGAGDTYRGTSVVYVRRSGIDATYAVAQAKVRPLLDALPVR